MNYSLRNILIVAGSLILSANLYAQTNKIGADSLINYLKSDESKDYRYKINYCDTLLLLFNNNIDYCSWIKIQILKSSYQRANGDFEDALSALNFAVNKYKQVSCNNSTLLPEIYLAYGDLYIQMHESKRAKYYLQKGIDCRQSHLNNKEVLIDLFNSKGSTFSILDSELFYFRAAYKMAVETNNISAQEVSLNLIGSAYAVNGNNKLAIYFLQRALHIALQRNEYSMLSGLYNNLAGLTTNSALVSKYLDSATYFAELKGNIQDIQTAYQNRALFYYQNGKYQKGYDELWASFVLSDSLYNLNKINAFADMEQKYEAEKKNTEIVLLKSENEIANLQSSRRLGISFGLGGALLGIVFVTLVFYSQNKKKQKLNTELLVEKKKSDDLLLNILPEEVAHELKQTGVSKARLYNHVTVLFTDFVNFTGISEQLSPSELVQEIHNNFTAFDAIMEKHGLEKIKTIGDAYLAVCGLPHELPDHAQRVAKAALEIQAFMKQNAGKFQIRMGIHSGAVVAGIVGVKKYAYDIWGDTVNMASRMESSSEAGKINTSQATFELIKDEFNCIPRGKIDVKNKGMLDMYYIDRSLSIG